MPLKERTFLPELREASEFGLTPEKYDDLVSRLDQRWEDEARPALYAGAREQIMAELAMPNSKTRDAVMDLVRGDAMPKLREEIEEKWLAHPPEPLRAALKVEVEKEIRAAYEAALPALLKDEMRADVRREVEAKMYAGVPSASDKAEVATFLREMQAHYLTVSEAASRESAYLRQARLTARFLSFGLLLSAAPALGGTFNIWPLSWFLALAGAYVLAAIYIGSSETSANREASLRTASLRASQKALSYAQAARVDLPQAATNEQLKRVGYQSNGSEVDMLPSAEFMKKARVEVMVAMQAMQNESAPYTTGIADDVDIRRLTS